MFCYQTLIFVIEIVTGECTVLLLQNYGIKFCAVLFGFWSSCLIVFIHFFLHDHTAITNNTYYCVIAIVTFEHTMLILQKYSFKVFVIRFDFYSTNYKVCIHLPCINTQRQTSEPFDITQVISSRNCQTLRLYQGSADNCEGDHNSDSFCLL